MLCHRTITKCLSFSLFALFILVSQGLNVFALNHKYINHNLEFEETNKNKKSESSNATFFGEVTVGYQDLSWKINKDDKNPVFDYKTEGLNLCRFTGNVGYGTIPFATVSYERPLKSTDKQEKMLEAHTRRESGLEKFTGGVKLDPLVNYLIADDTISKLLLRRVLSLRYKYTRELFFGEARALNNAYYLPKDASVDYENNIITGGKSLSIGAKRDFRTEFIDEEVSISLWAFDLPISLSLPFGYTEFKVAPHQFRIGCYKSEWNRPSDTSVITYESRPIIYEATYKSKGALVSVETININSPGINVDFSFKMGREDSLETAVDWNKHFDRHEVDINSSMIHIGIWYNQYFGKDRYQGVFFTVGGGWSKRAMNVDVKSEGESDTRVIHDSDLQSKLYATLGYKF